MQTVADAFFVLQPRHIVRTPYMHDWSRTRVFVERCYPQNDMGLSGTFGHKVAATNGAKMPELSGRRLERREFFFTLDPAEVLSHYAGCRSESGGVSLATSAAMAMTNWHVQLINFVLNGTTQTTTFHPKCLQKIPLPSLTDKLSRQAKR